MATPASDLATPRIRFAGADIKCIVLPFANPAPDLQVWRTQFAGTVGISEIVGGAGGRVLEIPIVLRSVKFISFEIIDRYVDDVLGANLVGQHGDLIVEPGKSLREPLTDGDGNPIPAPDKPVLRYANCTFHGFSVTRPPLPDEAGTMGTGAGRWTCVGVLRFYQTSMV